MKLKELYEEIIIRRQDKKMLFEMSNLTERQTGIPYVIFINFGAERAKHACRIKVCKGLKWQPGEDINIQIEGAFRVMGKAKWLTQKDFDIIKAWVTLNMDTIFNYWHSEIDTANMLAAIKPLNRTVT